MKQSNSAASDLTRELTSGLVAVENVSGLVSELFFENRAHRDAISVFRTLLAQERENALRMVEEAQSALQARERQLEDVREENRRLRHLGSIALQQLQETERRAGEAEARAAEVEQLLAEVSRSLGSKTVAAIETFGQMKARLRRISGYLGPSGEQKALTPMHAARGGI